MRESSSAPAASSASGPSIADHEPTYEDPERPTRLQPLHAAKVRVGEGARIGAHASLLAGATVAPGEVVGSYVTRAPRSDS